jgi:DNA-binding beta-propeller fold protein YncE
MSDHHEKELPGELKDEQRLPGEHLKLKLLGLALGGGVSTPFDARLAPDGGTLWVLDTGSATVSGFAVSGGNLAELPSSPTPLPAGATAFGIVVTSSSDAEKRTDR